MKWIFIVFLVYLLSLFFRRERLPGEWIEGLITPALPTNLVVHCDTATFGWRRGLKVENIKLYDLSRKNTLEPLFAAESIEVRPFDRLVRGVGVRVPRLHDGYYEEGGYAEPLGYGDWGVRLPKVPKFRLELFGANILGAAPMAGTVLSNFSIFIKRPTRQERPERSFRSQSKFGDTYAIVA